MKKALNSQIAMEGYASSYYLSMACWCDVAGYAGAASFFYAQSDEERQHMLKIVRYMNSIGVSAEIARIDQPPADFESLEGICKTALGNEQAVTVAIDKIVNLARDEKDHRTFAFLQWYVNEQILEETQFETILQKFDLIGRDKLALAEIDRVMGTMAAAGESGAA